ncbi:MULTISPECIES: TRAP transporter large permease [Stappiaceae]|jgi:tripartite ATP-independent transporter DctM subunit|uniref:TRAP transporter large permease n=1 Tax=Stappiaceae TaxID=2821832 RepID=UPI001268E223|nr:MULTISPECIES: TRAP transporter large permease subunit [Stappiaceae]MEC9469325.1 TRAP transporter large permease subunit [Pseudomonadota bacterium]QFS99297.1 Sialic acid TRAP transporter permease protein SiaT [Labrenzia sp. THAF191b]QFT05611.1 Sialic acid TRAP transporter permease protein SiaT [Labrenzia sp. THAF191a]QFT17155.1 Sialic acid TRAP transporter permease protein SiaT [Labrenzia sp. THAF187b]UES39886.1 TRAP transporter large permease subunit [Roseibium aggregatum]
MGLEIGIEWLTLIMFGSLLVLLMAGLPLAFVTGGLACVFLFVLGDERALNIVPSRIFPLMTNYQLSAIPLFIFMASMLERAGIINDMFDVIYKVLGGVKGGLAAATIIASTVLAAMVGVIGAAVVTMGIIALPAMLKRNYDPKIAMGSIMAGGTLGILIPPSILAIIYAVVAEQSVGELFIGAVIPGLLLSGLYILYVIVSCMIDPSKGPPIPEEERIPFKEKVRLLSNMSAPIALIVIVLGVIFTGVATPVEAAGIGTFGAIVVAAIHRNLDWQTLREASLTTLKASAMVIWIMFGATIFVGLYVLEGGQQFVQGALEATGLGPWGILIIMQIVLVVLGMFLDWVGILLLCVPIFVPIIKALGAASFGLDSPDDLVLWFGVLYLVNMQMSFLSPPFGYALFYLRGVAPADIPMTDIFKSALPFLALQVLGLALCMLFPGLITWLPNLVYG